MDYDTHSNDNTYQTNPIKKSNISQSNPYEDKMINRNQSESSISKKKKKKRRNIAKAETDK